MSSLVYNPFTSKLDFVDQTIVPPGTLSSLQGDSGGSVGPNGGGTIFVVGGSGVDVAGNPGTNTLTINIAQHGYTWSVVTSATNPLTLVAQTAYVTKGASAVVFLLPATAAVGDTFKIVGYGNLWQVTQNTGQTITWESTTSTSGTGTMTATNIRDCVEIVCVTANTEFQVTQGSGSPSFA